MSKELNVLLQHIHPDSPILKPSEKVPEPSRYLIKLVNRVENRRWLAEEIPAAEERLKEQLNEIKFIVHALKCDQCLTEFQLDVERYLGSHSCRWYLDLTNEVEFDGDEEFWETMPEFYKSMPRVKDYCIGSYWSGASDDTIRFVKDRLTWARKTIRQEVRVIRNYLRVLKNWDLKSDLPPDSYLFFWGARTLGAS